MSPFGKIGMPPSARPDLGVMSDSSDYRPIAQTGTGVVQANGKPTEARLPCTLEQFLLAQSLLPRSVVVEHNGQAVAPSEFSRRQLAAGDRLEIVKIVAGG